MGRKVLPLSLYHSVTTGPRVGMRMLGRPMLPRVAGQQQQK